MTERISLLFIVLFPPYFCLVEWLASLEPLKQQMLRHIVVVQTAAFSGHANSHFAVAGILSKLTGPRFSILTIVAGLLISAISNWGPA
jgi:hypothetical protein